MFVLAAASLCGCASMKTSNTARTGMEQLLISNAVDQSLDSVDFTSFRGSAVYLEEKYLDCVDKAYVLASLRHRLLREHARIVTKPDEADVVLEIRSGGVGTDNAESFVGIPEIVLPGMLTLPEVRFITRSRQRGTAKLGLVAYDAKSMHVLGEGGVSLAQSDDSKTYVLGMGPWQNGSVRSELEEGVSATASYQGADLPMHVAFAPPRSGDPPSPPFARGGAEGSPGETLPAGYRQPPSQPREEPPFSRAWLESPFR
jgi:hypothetical protein